MDQPFEISLLGENQAFRQPQQLVVLRIIFFTSSELSISTAFATAKICFSSSGWANSKINFKIAHVSLNNHSDFLPLGLITFFGVLIYVRSHLDEIGSGLMSSFLLSPFELFPWRVPLLEC